MSLPPEQKKGHRIAPPSVQDDEYGLREEPESLPRPTVPEFRPRPGLGLGEEEEEPPPGPPKLLFFTGVFTFPWRLRTLAAWLWISFALIVPALGLVFCIWLVDIGATIGLRFFLPPTVLVGALSLSYTAAACMIVIERTSQGYDDVIEWPEGMWREWVFTLLAGACILALPMAIGTVIGKLTIAPLWPSILLSVHFLFPVFLLSSLDTGYLLAPLSWNVLRSFLGLWWAWGLFYLETGALFGVWLVATKAAFAEHPVVTVLIAMPLLAAAILIYFRLFGRLAWCLAEYSDKRSGG